MKSFSSLLRNKVRGAAILMCAIALVFAVAASRLPTQVHGQSDGYCDGIAPGCCDWSGLVVCDENLDGCTRMVGSLGDPNECNNDPANYGSSWCGSSGPE